LKKHEEDVAAFLATLDPDLVAAVDKKHVVLNADRLRKVARWEQSWSSGALAELAGRGAAVEMIHFQNHILRDDLVDAPDKEDDGAEVASNPPTAYLMQKTRRKPKSPVAAPRRQAQSKPKSPISPAIHKGPLNP
jgi:hypothetical protein